LVTTTARVTSLASSEARRSASRFIGLRVSCSAFTSSVVWSAWSITSRTRTASFCALRSEFIKAARTSSRYALRRVNCVASAKAASTNTDAATSALGRDSRALKLGRRTPIGPM
jgi:hypothetical protein